MNTIPLPGNTLVIQRVSDGQYFAGYQEEPECTCCPGSIVRWTPDPAAAIPYCLGSGAGLELLARARQDLECRYWIVVRLVCLLP